MDFLGKLRFRFLILWFCVFVSLKIANAETESRSLSFFRWPPLVNSSSGISDQLPSQPVCSSAKNQMKLMINSRDTSRPLQYDFYRELCPKAEKIVRKVVDKLFQAMPDVAPALMRLVFHDCFIQKCLLRKILDVIDTIKSELEKVCPGVVCCGDILVLAARDCVALAGGPFYPLRTGRRNSTLSFRDLATYELPSPKDDLPQTLASFASRGFDERETVSFFGAHSIGMIHCQFFENCLYNFSGTHKPDPSLDVEFLRLMRSRCNNSHLVPASAQKPPFYEFVSSTRAPSQFHINSQQPSSEEAGMAMEYEGPRSAFGTVYYRNLLQGKGILYADQQLTIREETCNWVTAYAFDAYLFRLDFAMAMMKLSDLQVLTTPMGQIRLNCSKAV